MKNFIAALSMIITMVFAAATVAGEPPAQYQSSCFACHSSGAAGAPKTGDAEAWAPRLVKGMDVLVTSVKTGLNAMPPTGLCAACTDDEYQALIEFMAAPAE